MAILFNALQTVTADSGKLDVGGHPFNAFSFVTSGFSGSLQIQGQFNNDATWRRVRYWTFNPATLEQTGPHDGPIVPPATGEMHYYTFSALRSLRVSKTQGGGTIVVDHFHPPIEESLLVLNGGGSSAATSTEVTQSTPESLQVQAHLTWGGEDVDELHRVPVDTNMEDNLRAIAARLLASGTTTSKAEKALAAAGDYAANDVLSESATSGVGRSWYFPNCALEPGRSFLIMGIRARITEDSVTFRPQVNFFRQNPTASELDDNAAYNMVAADNRGKSLGPYTLPAFSDIGAETLSVDNDIRMMITPAGNEMGVYAIVKTLDAEANETAGMVLEIELEVIQF